MEQDQDTYTTIIQGDNDVEPIYYNVLQPQGLTESQQHKGLGLTLFLVGLGILGFALGCISIAYRVWEKVK